MKAWKLLSGFLPHLLLTCGIMLLTFYCITLVNEAMCFLSSFLSQKFEVAYAVVAILTVIASVSVKRLRVLPVLQVVSACAIAVPAVICTVQHRMDMVDTHWFRTVALVNAVVAIVFAVLMIVMQRRQARAAWQAASQTAPNES